MGRSAGGHRWGAPGRTVHTARRGVVVAVLVGLLATTGATGAGAKTPTMKSWVGSMCGELLRELTTIQTWQQQTQSLANGASTFSSLSAYLKQAVAVTDPVVSDLGQGVKKLKKIGPPPISGGSAWWKQFLKTWSGVGTAVGTFDDGLKALIPTADTSPSQAAAKVQVLANDLSSSMSLLPSALSDLDKGKVGKAVTKAANKVQKCQDLQAFAST